MCSDLNIKRSCKKFSPCTKAGELGAEEPAGIPVGTPRERSTKSAVNGASSSDEVAVNTSCTGRPI
eukprot:5067222-Amphidinium_carterae.1